MPKRQETVAQILQGGIRKHGDHLDTKHELKELVETSPRSLEFYSTSQFPPTAGVTIRLDELKLGQKLVIVGPDPRNERKWYANIERKSSGQLRCT